jgi:hypothetical protein
LNPPKKSAIHKPFVVKSTTARDVTIAIIAGLALLSFVLWGILHMSQEVSGHPLLTGKILAKHFQPQQEEQLTIGRGGLDEKNIDGIYTMDVRTPDGHTYTVFVEKSAYISHNPGDDLTFLPPPSRQQ